ncbi:MAG: hypothetical protein WC263_00725 [Candidatus Micrarchaeia archaeon]
MNKENATLKKQLNWNAGTPVEINPGKAFWHPWKIARAFNRTLTENVELGKRVENLTQVEPEKVVEKKPEQSPIISVSEGEKSIVAPAREINFESMKLLASGDTRLTTSEIIALYTGWPIRNAIADEKKARQFIEDANSWLPSINQPKISETGKINSLMAAMLPLQDAIAAKSKFHKFSPASDSLFVTVDSGNTFCEANKMGNDKWFITKDILTGQLWAIELPKTYFGHDGNEIDIVKKVSGKQEFKLCAVMTTPLGNVKKISSLKIKENDIQKLKLKPGSSIYVLDIDPSAWRTFEMGERNSEYSGCYLQYDENGRLNDFEGELYGAHSSTHMISLNYKSVHPRPNWLGLLVAGPHCWFDLSKNQWDVRHLASNISAAHPQSLPMDVIIDTGKISQNRTE